MFLDQNKQTKNCSVKAFIQFYQPFSHLFLKVFKQILKLPKREVEELWNNFIRIIGASVGRNCSEIVAMVTHSSKIGFHGHRP